MSASLLQKQLLQTYSIENLNHLSAKLIDFQKNKQKHCLKRMGELVNEYSPMDLSNNSKLFAKLIMLYHPDKLVEYKKGIRECLSEEALNKFAHIIPMLSLVNQLNGNASSTFQTPAEFEQEYGWSYENTADDYYVVRDDDDTIDPLYDEENLDENALFGTGPIIPEESFLGAVKRKVYGPLQINFPVHQLEDMEDIEMAEYEIETLDGVEYCSYVKILDLSYNQIIDISKLEYCEHVQELYLQNNQIHFIDALYHMPDLRVVDLANNQIHDISVLMQLRCLEFVNLLGNPISQLQINELSAKEVVVVS